MVDTLVEYSPEGWDEYMNMIYGKHYLEFVDAIERNDFYSISGEGGISFIGEKLFLTTDSHVLDLCSGIGGPARFLAKKYGCQVTGIDISEYNHNTAIKRTTEVGLENLVNFIQGDALDIPLPDQSVTHVIGCDSWTYFPEKVQLYKAAHRVLKPEGRLAFLEIAVELDDIDPNQFQFNKLLGRNYPETVSNYVIKLKEAGFGSIQYNDSTEIVCKEITNVLYKMVTRRKKIIEIVGSSGFYYKLMEFWVEMLSYLSEREWNHCCFIALKNKK